MGKVLAAIQGGVRAFSYPAGIGVIDEPPLEDRFDDVAQGVVHHPIPKRRGGNQAGLGVVNAEVAVFAGTVGLGFEFVLELKQFVLQVELEGRHVPFAALAFGGFFGRLVEVFKIGEGRVEVFEGFHCWTELFVVSHVSGVDGRHCRALLRTIISNFGSLWAGFWTRIRLQMKRRSDMKAIWRLPKFEGGKKN